MKYIFRFVNLVIFSVVLQALYFVALVYTLVNLSPSIHFIMTALGIFCVFFIVSGRDAAVYRLSWCVPILLFPAVMGMVYLFYNRRVTGRKIEADMLTARKNALNYIDRGTVLTPGNPNNKRLARYIEKTTGTPPASYKDAEYFAQGEDFYNRFLEELACAERYIFIEFFLVERGKMWDKILSVLVRKRNEGVEVRLMFDGLATLYTLPRKYYKNMREMGIECVVYNPLRSLLSFRLNTRNHRKIAVIDGHTAFCGGLNLADNYINAKPAVKTGHWKDSAVMVKGGAAWNFALSFLSMWEFLTRKSEDYNSYIPNSTDLMTENRYMETASVWHDLPLDCESVSERIFLNFINRADDYIYIMTPYLAPSEEIISALCAAAGAGTDVRLMLPFIPDKFIVSAVTKSNYLPLLEAGVRIFEYPPGFIHSKNIVADDSRAAISTVNFDYRALYMHHECGICLYGSKIIADIKRDFVKTQKNSREVTLEAHRKTGAFKRGVRRVCRILAPLV
ncbi:MAG: phosphatidylserine/phosphatidylglycerophosphate/cardiolipin synthase family protein [Oscillospiraceae bacterium]|jgi:cardiolipin synthase|nr:phosphatidylserine/phosphatidylglycerophosphate/cardiolipin synthase family protein [Oscillospiraceae bacterium]